MEEHCTFPAQPWAGSQQLELAPSSPLGSIPWHWCPHLSQALFAEGAVGPVVQAALQALLAEGVTTGRGHRLEEHPAKGDQSQWIAGSNKGKGAQISLAERDLN